MMLQTSNLKPTFIPIQCLSDLRRAFVKYYHFVEGILSHHIGNYEEGHMRAIVLILVGLVMLSGSVFAQTPDDFIVDSAQDLLVLCSADPTSPTYTAAIHFCHGFASGAYRHYKVHAAADPSHEFICLPNPPPTRTAAINDFIAWMKENPQHMDGLAIDAIFRYLAEKYPCDN